jgi:hypothetical protein
MTRHRKNKDKEQKKRIHLWYKTITTITTSQGDETPKSQKEHVKIYDKIKTSPSVSRKEKKSKNADRNRSIVQ